MTANKRIRRKAKEGDLSNYNRQIFFSVKIKKHGAIEVSGGTFRKEVCSDYMENGDSAEKIGEMGIGKETPFQR